MKINLELAAHLKCLNTAAVLQHYASHSEGTAKEVFSFIKGIDRICLNLVKCGYLSIHNSDFAITELGSDAVSGIYGKKVKVKVAKNKGQTFAESIYFDNMDLFSDTVKNLAVYKELEVHYEKRGGFDFDAMHFAIKHWKGGEHVALDWVKTFSNFVRFDSQKWFNFAKNNSARHSEVRNNLNQKRQATYNPNY